MLYYIKYQFTGGKTLKKQIAILLLAAVMFTACGSKSKISTGNEPVKTLSIQVKRCLWQIILD